MAALSFLYTTIPRFEELSAEEQKLYHHSKDTYITTARKHGKNLHFAKSGTKGETWVPLIEKAYAKLHGNYAALDGGDAGEAIEDLTGGVTSLISIKDILSPDEFWRDELEAVARREDRLFGCSFDTLKRYCSNDLYPVNVNGLIGGHAYSVLRAVKHNNKRFVVLRNPWGNSEWTGRWSDGSKEWTTDWLSALKELNHSFGNDGQFVMEYSDFLQNWEMIDRTRLFDASWIMSSQWLMVKPRESFDSGYGDISFTISLDKASSAIIVLSKLDERYYGAFANQVTWSFDFLVFKKGEKIPIAASSPSLARARSVNAEVKVLPAGTYVVHVRLDRHDPPLDSTNMNQDSHSLPEPTAPSPPQVPPKRVASRILAERIKSHSVASNFDQSVKLTYLSTPIHELAGKDLSEVEFCAEEEIETTKLSIAIDPELRSSRGSYVPDFAGSDGSSSATDDARRRCEDELPGVEKGTIVLGLRVYTHKTSPVKIQGQLRPTY
ncbi:hypothetical protein H0H87_006131 [Tephrocybe sp. NHM501043]|nr:hypothetical protein H0H87_006131 [Tephrocybe sp. NHM501043]